MWRSADSVISGQRSAPVTHTAVAARINIIQVRNELRSCFVCPPLTVKLVAQVAQIFGGVNTLSGYVGTESVSAEFSTTASEPWLRLHVTVEE